MANEVSDAELAELERLEAAATEAPWYASGRHVGLNEPGFAGVGATLPTQHLGVFSDRGDAALACAARNALSGLLARLRAAEERCRSYEQAWDEYSCVEVQEAYETDDVRSLQCIVNSLVGRLAARSKRVAELERERDEWKEKADVAHQVGFETGSKMEEVICAAIRLPDGRIFRGHRRHDCIATALKVVSWNGGVDPGDHHWDEKGRCHDQGFITSRNRYVDRKEGMRLQLAAGIESVADGGYRGQLYSEDLYR